MAPGALRRGLLVLALTAFLGGCASPGGSSAPADVRPQRLERKAATARSFDAQRDQAEFTDALASWRQGDSAGCRQTLDGLLRRNAGHREAALLRAEVAQAERQPGDGVALLEPLAAALPDDAEVQRALARLRREVAAPAIETPAVALAGYQDPPSPSSAGSAVSAAWDDTTGTENPSVGEFLASAGECLRSGEAGEAARLAERGLQAHPRSAALYRTMGLAYYRLGDYLSAERALRQSLSLDNSSALAYFLLGSALRGLGEAEAEECFRRARSLDARF